MKLCIFTENDYQGGLDTFLISLVEAWPDSRAHITLMCNVSHPGLETIRAASGRLNEIRPYRRPFGGRISRGLGVKPYLLSRALRAASTISQRVLQYPILAPWYILYLRWVFRRADFTHLMVVNGGYPASLACRCACVAWRLSRPGRRALLSFHNSYQPPGRLERALDLGLDRWVAESCHAVVSVSDNCLQSLEENPAFRKASRTVIENGIDDIALVPTSSACAEEIQELPSRYCLMLATLEERKGHEFVLRAFQEVLRRHPDIHLCMFGHGTPREERRVRGLIEAMGLGERARLGPFTRCGPALIRGADVLLVPSQALESFGLTIIEAMALSRPVVATDVGGIPQVLRGTGAGTVVSGSDAVAFADAVCEILSDPELAGRMGRDGRAAFDARFSSRRMASAYREILCRHGGTWVREA